MAVFSWYSRRRTKNNVECCAFWNVIANFLYFPSTGWEKILYLNLTAIFGVFKMERATLAKSVSATFTSFPRLVEILKEFFLLPVCEKQLYFCCICTTCWDLPFFILCHSVFLAPLSYSAISFSGKPCFDRWKQAFSKINMSRGGSQYLHSLIFSSGYPVHKAGKPFAHKSCDSCCLRLV